MLADHKDGLLSSGFSLILDSSVGLLVGIQSAGDSVSKTLDQILHSAEEDKLSPLDLKIACLFQSTEINNNKHVYRQSQVRKPNGSGVEWAECLLIIGTGCWVQSIQCIEINNKHVCMYVCMYLRTYVRMYVCMYFQLSSAASGTSLELCFWHNFSGMKRSCWTTGSWQSCLSLEVVSTIPPGPR